MPIVNKGKNPDGSSSLFHLDEYMTKNLDEIKKRVEKGNWDSKIIIAGYSGVGKSHTVQFFARYLCEWFDSSYYCFTINEFKEKATNCPEHSAVILDESFDSMNSKASLSKEFQKVISFLQIIRQKHLYIFLLLPNFFDLSKSVALYNSNLLVVCYTTDSGQRGRYAVFDRDAKKNLYIRGLKMMDYGKENPNFRGQVPAKCIIDWEDYERRKANHLKEQIKKEEHEKKSRPIIERDKLLSYNKEILGLSVERLNEITAMPPTTIYDALRRYKDFILKKFSKSK